MSADAASVSTVEHGGFTITGSGSAKDALASLQSAQDSKSTPEGESEVAGEPEKPKGKAALSQAASTLGAKGGKAAAKARAAAAEQDDAEPAKEAKPAEPAKGKATAEDEDDEPDLAQHPRAKARVEEATRAAAEAKRELARERSERERVSRELEETRRARTQPAEERREAPTARQDATREPVLKEFLAKHPGDEAEAISQYVKASNAYNRQTWEAEQRQKAETSEHQRAIGQTVQGFMGRLEKAHEAGETFKERTGKAQPLFGGQSIPEVLQPSFTLQRDEHGRIQGLEARHVAADEVLKSEQGPALILHFSEHPEDLQRINALTSPDAIIRAVAQIEGRLEGATAGNPPADDRPAPKPESSKAPPPVRPVTGAPSIAAGGFREGMSLDDYAKGWKPGPQR